MRLIGCFVAFGVLLSACSADDNAGVLLPETDGGRPRDASSGEVATDARAPSDSATADVARVDGSVGEDGSSNDGSVGVEICNNGLDDDGDGVIDGMCPCIPGTSQRCYPGMASTVGVGACTFGMQRCEGTGEFGNWTACTGAVVPTMERCGDTIDQDCDGTADNRMGCCAPGASERCYTGPMGTEGMGICRPGTHTCERDGMSFGSCLDEVGPRMELCDNGLDDDCNGMIDDAAGCMCRSGTTRMCYPGPMSEVGVGRCRAGSQMCVSGGTMFSACAGAVGPSSEVCGNMIDDDCDGMTDEGCVCVPGATRACYTGAAGTAGVGRCRNGSQTCNVMGQWGACTGSVVPAAEVCGNMIDDDCDGMVDEGCPPAMRVCTVNVSLDGDCLTARCPSDCGFPIGCNITMSGDDDRGCVASRPDQPSVYFQEGDACGAGRVRGTLTCSNVRGVGLNASNCRINKDRRYYPADRSGCPDT